MMTLAVHTLPAYCSNAAAFVAVVPAIVANSKLGKAFNFTTYQSRLWCRAEQFCHATVNGIGHMWIATSCAAAHISPTAHALPPAASAHSATERMHCLPLPPYTLRQ